MAKQGHLDMLVKDWALLPEYWQHYLRDFPDHPAATHPGLSIPCTLYRDWVVDWKPISIPLSLKPIRYSNCSYSLGANLECPFKHKYSGDETTAINESWMFLIWQSDMTPCPTNSAASRFLVAIIPSSLYALTPDKTNLTLQAGCWEIKESFNKLSQRGLVPEDLPSRGGHQVPRISQ